MKFNRSEIMKAAWDKHRRFGSEMSVALRMAWYEAKAAITRYNVYGEMIGSGAVTLIESGVTYERAGYLEYACSGRYDRITVKAA